jgi:hypothetical protein
MMTPGGYCTNPNHNVMFPLEEARIYGNLDKNLALQ